MLASDVLYEKPYGNLVAQAIGASLADDGVAYLADPGRVGRPDFLGHLAGADLRVRRTTELQFEEGAVRQTITLFEIAHFGHSGEGAAGSRGLRAQ